MGSELCFYMSSILKGGKGYDRVSIARLCSCILDGLTPRPGFATDLLLF